MIDTEQNFIACIKNLESFNSEYIQANKQILETRSLTRIQPTPLVLSPGSTTVTPTTTPVVVNDYIRMCRMYCVMLWTYCDAFNMRGTNLEELQLIRHCLIHHEGDMAKYSQDSTYGSGGTKLINITNGKSYVQEYILLMSDVDLITFTSLVKAEFTAKTGVIFDN